MNLSILEKILLILKFFTSSFLGIELFLLVLLFSCFIFLNMKFRNMKVRYALPLFLALSIFVVVIIFHGFALSSIKSFIKSLMYYYYFPNMALYFVIVLVITIIFIYTLLTRRLKKRKKIINYSFFIPIYTCFIGLVGYVSLYNIPLVLNDSMYKYDTVLSFVQISNLCALLWITVTAFYYLYKYFKKKFN